MRTSRTCASEDFAPNMLPTTRRQLFNDVLKIHWKRLLVLGCIMLLFTLPLSISQWVQDAYNMYVQTVAQQLESAEAEEMYYSLAIMDAMRQMVNVLLWGVVGLGIAGSARIIRQFAWGEYTYLLRDFIQGIRENGKHMVLLFAFTGFIYGMCYGVIVMSQYQSELLTVLSFIQVSLSVVAVLPTCALCLTMIPVYKNTFKQYMRLSFVIYLKTNLKTLFAIFCVVILYAPLLLPVPFVHIIGGVVHTLLTPYIFLGWTLYTYSVYDEHINPRYYPELVGRGLFYEDASCAEKIE